MYGYEDDYERYYEPSPADEILTEYQNKMKEVLLDTIKYQIEQTNTENVRLKAENKKLKDNENAVRSKERELENQKNDLMRQVKRERLSKLMEDFEVVMYKAYSTTVKLSKCDKCNDNRKIEFLSPSGKQVFEDCECNVGKTVYIPQEYICTEFKVNRDDGAMLMWFKANHEKDYDYYSYDSSDYRKTIYKDEISYEELDTWNTYFKNKEDCQKYCDWRNSKEENRPISLSPKSKK